MNTPKIVLLNGPPRSGKDTAARAIIAELRRIATDDAKRSGLEKPDPATFPSYADIVGAGHELKEMTHAAYGMPGRAHDYYEKVKGEPSADFDGRTPRDAYIHFSEAVMKPAFGQDVFGRRWINRIARMGLLTSGRVIVVPDAGFAAEWEPVLAVIPNADVLLVQIDASRRGCTFEGDSRGYITLPVDCVTLENNRPGTIGRAVFQHDAARAVVTWLEQRAIRIAMAAKLTPRLMPAPDAPAEAAE